MKMHSGNARHAGHVIEERLRQMRKTQRWLKEQVGVSDNAVSLWVKYGEISDDHRAAIARALDVTEEALRNADQNPALVGGGQGVAAEEVQLHMMLMSEFALIDVMRRTSPIGQDLIRAAIRSARELIPKEQAGGLPKAL